MAADIHLDVPFVTQINIGKHAGGNYTNEWTGCWYAAVCMVAYFHEAGPRLGVPAQYTLPKFGRKQDGTIDPTHRYLAPEPIGARYAELKANEGLVAVPLPADKKWTCIRLSQILKEHGPCYVRRGFLQNGVLTGGHAIVLVGSKMSNNTVIYHCPTNGPDQVMSIDEWNKVFKWSDARAKDYSMMYKRGKAAPAGRVKALVQQFGG
jgi:hypothetical protein